MNFFNRKDPLNLMELVFTMCKQSRQGRGFILLASVQNTHGPERPPAELVLALTGRKVSRSAHLCADIVSFGATCFLPHINENRVQSS